MKKIILSLCALAIGGAAMAEDAPLWLRNTAISPDGKTIAFTFRGDIYTVPAAGGSATRLTVNGAYDTRPLWSPDGSRIAFESNRAGSSDIFVINAKGGTPERITTFSGSEVPRAWLDNNTILFTSNICPSEEDLNAPFFMQTYVVDAVPGSRPRLYLSLHTEEGDVNDKGDFIFADHKSYENAWRKHETSSGTSNIQLYSDGKFTRLTDFAGSDRNPVWLGNNGDFAFLSERNGTLNVFSGKVGSKDVKQLTKLERHPVRSLSASADGKTLAFSYDGEIYTVVPGAQPKKVNVNIITDNYDRDIVRGYITHGASNMAVSPSGDEVAFVIRGDVYVTSVKYKTTKRITDTPGQERCLTFSEDGRTLVYDSERDGKWALYATKIKNDNEKNFAYSTDLEEELLYGGDFAAQQPEFSPDGKKVAFLQDRTEIKVIDMDTKEVKTALDGKYNYSYVDGDVDFTWSPDSRYLLASYIGEGGWNNTDIALVSADGTEVVDLTESGYSDGTPHWALDGKAITYATGKYGMKSHGSWGNENDVMLMVLDGEAWDKFTMTEEEAELAEKAENDKKSDESADDSKDKKKDKKNKKKDKEEAAKAAPEPVAFDFDNRKYRMRRLTGQSGRIGQHFLSPKGDKLYYVALSPEGSYNLYVRDMRKGDTRVLAGGKDGGFVPDKKGENIYMLSGHGMSKINLASGNTEQIEFEAPYDRHPSLERDYIYGHAWQQVKDKFYDANIHGVDWEGYGKDYRKFLPYIDNNTDFAIMLSELLGELNASHTGARAGTYGPDLQTASLGAYYDDTYQGDGLKVKKVMPRGPLSPKKVNIMPGDIIMAIDGQKIEAGKDYFPLLDGKAGKKTRLTVQKADGSTTYVTVKPMQQGAQSSLLYDMWVEHNQAVVDSLSNGRIGYVHIQGMDSPSFRTAYDQLLGKYRNCDAVIVDTRFNGGGWLHNDVAQLLSGREYVRFTPRGQYIGHEPFSQVTKPSVMLVNEANYSDAYGTPFTYQALGIGKLVGAPVPGTMTAVWWEGQIDPSIVFGIPQVTCIDNEGNALENRQLQPEIEVYNTPAEIVSGNDLQIRAAVEELLKQVDAK